MHSDPNKMGNISGNLRFQIQDQIIN